MREAIVVLALVGCISFSGSASAAEKSIAELPKDAADLAFVWTEPIKGVAQQTRRLDPISGLCVGLFKGSVKSVARTLAIFTPGESSAPSSTDPSKQPLLRYSF